MSQQQPPPRATSPLNDDDQAPLRGKAIASSPGTVPTVAESTPQAKRKPDPGLRYPKGKVLRGTIGPIDDMVALPNPQTNAKIVIDLVSDSSDEAAKAAPKHQALASSPDDKKPVGMQKNAKRYSKITKMAYSDNEISPEEKMAALPEYAWIVAPVSAPDPTTKALMANPVAAPMARVGVLTKMAYSDNEISPEEKMAALPRYARMAAPVSVPDPNAKAPIGGREQHKVAQKQSRKRMNVGEEGVGNVGKGPDKGSKEEGRAAKRTRHQ
ncbi:hypothetical protein P7C71_g3546, partial [Lecanoromycetidae sp. Uapishka_2]